MVPPPPAIFPKAPLHPRHLAASGVRFSSTDPKTFVRELIEEPVLVGMMGW